VIHAPKGVKGVSKKSAWGQCRYSPFLRGGGFIEGRVILYDETSFLLVDVFLPF
jgi:hypothetical protein